MNNTYLILGFIILLLILWFVGGYEKFINLNSSRSNRALRYVVRSKSNITNN